MFFSDAVAQSVAFVNIANVAVVCALRIVNLFSVIAPREHVFQSFSNIPRALFCVAFGF